MKRSLRDVEDGGAAEEWIVGSPLDRLGLQLLAVPCNLESLVPKKGVEQCSYKLCSVERPVLQFWRYGRALPRNLVGRLSIVILV